MTEKDITICGHGSGFPSTKNMHTYLESRYKQIASNGVHKGLVAVRRLKNFTDAQRVKFHDAYRSILGRNYYSQNLRTHVFVPYNGKYYSDCSSSGDACFGKAEHDVGWLNTAGQYQSSLFEDVPVKIESGHVQNPEILKVGDCLLFAGNDPSRPKQIGHVEYVYEMPVSDTWHWVYADGVWYYQNAYGTNSYGWKVIKESSSNKKHWYYFDNAGRMCEGLTWIGNELYYLLESGALEGACCITNERGALIVWDI